MYDDTIAAISTPPGEGGIGIVRLSGHSAIEIVKNIFRTGKNRKKPSYLKSHNLYYGYIIDPSADNNIDEVILSIMKAPRSYTKEDVVEINSHSGIIVMKRILDVVLAYGARIAEPGEFTRRAFLNGRIDLAQAEAVMDIIRAKTDASLKFACNQLEGKLSSKIKNIYDRLADCLAHIEADIDYPEDDISPVNFKSITENIEQIITEIKQLLNTVDYGKIFRDGIKIAIVGRPNTGKSSLLNAILRENRAIVTEIPGTTRDSIEEYINLGGFPIQLIDTAGIRKTEDQIEKLGVRRSYETISRADLILYLLDTSDNFNSCDLKTLADIPSEKIILVLNKIDLPRKLKLPQNISCIKTVEISLLTYEGSEIIEKTILEILSSGKVSCEDGIIISNMRHKKSIMDSYNSLLELKTALEKGFSSDILAIDLKNALNSLGEILGYKVTEDILNRIFENFCVGK